jgi:murein DD-endopeptidase
MSTERQDVDVPRSLAVLALVLLPIAGCASAPAQADPALDANTVSAQPAQDARVEVTPSPPGNESSVVSALTALDVEDGAVLTLAGHDGVVVAAPSRPVPDVPDIGADAVRVALDMVGTPYVWGGNTPRGFDCSGLVQYSYTLAGLELPRVTIKQRSASRAVSRKQLRPGDLLFFHIEGKRYSHIGIYIGDGQFVHAPRTGKFVTTASLSNPYWRKFFGGARRPVSEDRMVSGYSGPDRVSALERVRTEQ